MCGSKKGEKVGNGWYFYDEFKMSKDLNATCTLIFNKSEDELDLRVRRSSTLFCKDMRQIQRYISIWEQYHQLTICSADQTQHNKKLTATKPWDYFMGCLYTFSVTLLFKLANYKF